MASGQGSPKLAGAILPAVLLLAALTAQPASARVSLSCSDATNNASFGFSDPASLRVKMSASYFDAPGGGDKIGYRYKGVDSGGPTAGSGACTNTDANWNNLDITLGKRDDSARLDAKKPAPVDPTERIPQFVSVSISAGDGDDTLKGHLGYDGFSGGPDNDVIDVAGGGGDFVDCGGGAKDVVRAKGPDVTTNCEKVISG